MPCKNTAALLKALAEKYETPDFLTDDPSQFMHRFANPVDQELFAFVAAQLAFGKRELFIAKVNKLYDAAMDCKSKSARAESEGKLKTADAVKSVGKPKTRGASFAGWLASGGHQKFFPKSQKKFYRFFSYADMNALCGRLAQIVEERGSLGAAGGVGGVGVGASQRSSPFSSSSSSLRRGARSSSAPGRAAAARRSPPRCRAD